jgi:non-canonical poly(A) RNA polymerase PAPD5/7
MREKLIEDLRSIVQTSYKGCILQLYGSFATGLCLPTSDIDLMITGGGIESQWHPTEVLAVIETQLLKAKQIVEKCELIKSLSMPVLKVMCNKDYNYLNVDITVKDSKHKGLDCVGFVKECLISYPQIEAVVLALKQMLLVANLANPYTGGIGSYTVLLMLVECIQRFYQSLDVSDDGSLLLSFFYMYGSSELPFRIDPQRPGSKKPTLYEYIEVDNEVPLIIDPLTQNNNVSKSSYLFNKVLVLL